MSRWQDRPWCTKCGKHRTQNRDGICRHCGPNARRLRQCTKCGLPTQSTTGLCVEHRPSGKGQRGPCIHCGHRTVTADRVCRRCKDLQAAGMSEGLVLAEDDAEDESPLELEKGTGYWRQRRGIREWVPLLVEPEPQVVDDPDVGECAYKNCGVWFVVRRANHLYCSDKCRNAAVYIRRVEVAA